LKHLQEVEPSCNIEVMNRNLVSAITVVMNKMIPKRVVHTRKSTDLVNYHIEAAKKRRDRLFKQFCKTGCPVTLKKMKDLNLVIKRVIKRERNRTLNAKMKDSSTKTFWHSVNTMLGRSSGIESITLKDDANNVLSEDESA
jgi:hypothetical protein